MAKIYRATITFDIYPEENGLLDMITDNGENPMTEEELIEFARSEMIEVIYNGAKYGDIENMVDVEVIDA
jgi:hypothetical protein